MEQRKSYKDVKGKAQTGQTPVRLKTEALYDGGLSRSSEEAPVMGMERRTEVIQLELPLTTYNKKGRDKGTTTRSVPITQKMILAAYHKVRSNKGSAGIDKETLERYEERKADNLYILWNRMSSGCYFPPPVLEVSIPKDDGRKRKLGIPTVNDRVAQQVVKNYLEPRLESEFLENSYGYRPLKSAHQALAEVQSNVRKYSWVIDMDISGFFDNMSHELLNKALEKHVEEKWVMMYISRWLTAPIEDKSGNTRVRNGKGTPQGGVISPLLANLFLHYAIDKWISLKYPHLRFVRYADDIIVHSRSQKEAEEVLLSIKKRLAECDLSVNEKKTKIVYCKNANHKGLFKTVKFDFLGFSFQPRPTSTKDGKMFLGYDCAISCKSEKKIVGNIRDSNFHLWTESNIIRIAEYFNSKIRGWINYYGKFRIYSLTRIFRIFNERLLKWAIRRYKRFGKSRRKARRWILGLVKSCPTLFVHWRYGFQRA